MSGWSAADLDAAGVSAKIDDLPSLEQCAAEGGRGNLLLLLRESGVGKFSDRRKIATVVEQSTASACANNGTAINGTPPVSVTDPAPASTADR